MCKDNVSRLIKYVGYGNAAGFLADHGLMAGNKDEMAGDYSTDDEESDTEEYERIKDQIDPMTGQCSLLSILIVRRPLKHHIDCYVADAGACWDRRLSNRV